MCGIYGYIGEGSPTEICLQGLKALEYRGYDSAGIAGIFNGQILFRKEVGKLSSLESSLQNDPLPLHIAIAHTRWATHGKPSQENAHPQFDSAHSLAIVHNGIIENYQQLRDTLKQKGLSFASDTDTEVIAQLIASCYRGDLLEAVFETTPLLSGFWAFALIHKDHPQQIIAASRGNPLAIAANASKKEVFLSSDANAFHVKDLDLLFLHNGEVARISPERTEVFNHARVAVTKTTEKLELDQQLPSKNGFAHFMMKEICEQPHTIEQAFHNRFSIDTEKIEFEGLELKPEELREIQNVLIIGCGTSWHAGLIGASFLEEIAHLPARAEVASEFRHRHALIPERTLVIAISQSGETFDTIAAAREAKQKGSKLLAICNKRHSTLIREAHASILLRAGPEVSVCSTKAFTSQLTVLFLLGLLMSQVRHSLPPGKRRHLLQELQELPHYVESLLMHKDEIQGLARLYAAYGHIFFLGRHYMFPTALESALKLKEISYIHATGYPAGEMKHGPIALVNSELAVIGLCGNQHTLDKTMSNLIEMKSRGAPLLILAPKDRADLSTCADHWIPMPLVSDPLAPIVYTVACQLLSYFIALEKGTDIDQPRNLAKSVTVE